MNAPRPTSIRSRDNSWWEARHEILDRWLRSALKPVSDGTYLKTDLWDEASGDHHHANVGEQPQGFVGVDVEFEVAQAARGRLRDLHARPRIVVADVRSLPFRSRCFDGVVSLSTLDHLPDGDAIVHSLGELARVLKMGGRLALTLDNPANPEVWLRAHLPAKFVARLRADQFQLGATVGRRAGRRMLAAAGLRVLEERALVHAPRYIAIRLFALAARHLPPSFLDRLVKAVVGLEGLAGVPVGWLSGHYLGWVVERTAADGLSLPVPARE